MGYKDTYNGMKRGGTYPSVDGNPDFTVPGYDPAMDNAVASWAALKRFQDPKAPLSQREEEALAAARTGQSPWVPEFKGTPATNPSRGADPADMRAFIARHADMLKQPPPGWHAPMALPAQAQPEPTPNAAPSAPAQGWHPPMAPPAQAGGGVAPAPAGGHRPVPRWMQELQKMGIAPGDAGVPPPVAAAMNPPPDASVAAGPNKAVAAPPDPTQPPPSAPLWHPPMAPQGWHPPMALGAKMDPITSPVPKAVADRQVEAAQAAAAAKAAPKAPVVPSGWVGGLDPLGFGKAPLETTKEGDQNTETASDLHRRNLQFSPEEFTSLYQKYMNTPMAQDQLSGLDHLKQLMSLRSQTPTQMDLSSVMAGADWLNNGKTRFAQDYSRPETSQSKLDDIMAYAQKLQTDKSQVAKTIMDAARMDKAGFDQNQLQNKQMDFYNQMLQDPRTLYKGRYIDPFTRAQAFTKGFATLPPVKDAMTRIGAAKQALLALQNPNWMTDTVAQGVVSQFLGANANSRNAIMQQFGNDPSLAGRFEQTLARWAGEGKYLPEERKIVQDYVQRVADNSSRAVEELKNKYGQAMGPEAGYDSDTVDRHLSPYLLDTSLGNGGQPLQGLPPGGGAPATTPPGAAQAAPAGSIKVRRLSDGKTGTMSADDPALKSGKYERVQ